MDGERVDGRVVGQVVLGAWLGAKVFVLGWTFFLVSPTSIEETKPERLGLWWELPS